MWGRITEQWMSAALPMAVLMLVLTPVAYQGAPDWFLLLWLLLPTYLVHQAEEYDADRSRLFVNAVIYQGRDALTVLAGFVVNVGVVWFGFAVTFGLALYVHPAFGLIGVYTVLINAAVHSAASLRYRRANPGLYAAVTLFPVMGGWAWATLAPMATLPEHLMAAAVALAGHVAIIATVTLRLRHLPAPDPAKQGKSA